jgi:polar amino acid transport system substrate-binding protein
MEPSWRQKPRSLAVAALITILTASSPAQEADHRPTTIRVGTRVLPPMVMQSQGRLSGFSIDLWQAIAERLKARTEFKVAPDVPTLLGMVRSGQVDAGIAAISITSERRTLVDFSQPMMNAGLQILVRGKAGAPANPLRGLLNQLFSKTFVALLSFALLLILVPAHLVWLLERKHPSGMFPTQKYYPGILHALYWASSTLATQGNEMPRQWLARIITILWMFTGVVFVAFYTAQLSATLTVEQIQESINGPADLKGKTVATTRGSTASRVLRELDAQVIETGRIEEAYDALLQRRADAVVFDAPVLLYYAANGGRNKAHIVGTPFHKEDYGIAFQEQSALRKQVDRTLLALREDGTYQRLYDKWFSTR